MRTKDPKVQVYVKIPISLFNALHDYVDFADTTMAEFIRSAIREKLEQEMQRGKTHRVE